MVPNRCGLSLFVVRSTSCACEHYGIRAFSIDLMLLYTMLYIVLAYLMLFAALTNSVCLNNASFFFFFLNIFYVRAMSSPEK